MLIGKFVKIDNNDYVIKDNQIWQVIDSIASHPYWPNKYCMFDILLVHNRTNGLSEQYAKLIEWDNAYDWKTGKLI